MPDVAPQGRLAVASVITVVFMGSVVVTPIYPLYQQEFGFSDVTLTLVYAVYVVGNVVALLLFGQVSDQVGRRPVAVPALALAAASGLLFLFAGSTAWLFLARAAVGLAVGVASGTATAWLAELYGESGRGTAAVAAATANMTGIALGPLVGGLLAQYAPAPLHLPFVAYVLAVAAVGAAVLRAPETVRERVGWSGVRIRPRVGVPRDRAAAFVAPAVTGFVIFALGGLYFALIPGIVSRQLGVHDVAVAGLLVVELGLLAVVVIVLGRHWRPATAMTAGLVLLWPAVALLVAAEATRSLPLLVVAAALAGVTLALGYRGSLQVVGEIAPDDRRAELVSSYYIACFVGNSVPVIGVGVLAQASGSLVASAVFAGVVALLSLGALVSRWGSGR